MSILNGGFSAEILKPKKMPFGEEFETGATAELVGAADCAKIATYADEFLVAVGKGLLHIYKIVNDELRCVSEVIGLGDSRQISIFDKFAYISSRADGLFIVDLKDIQKPKIVYNLNTLELATGVCATDGVLAVTSRHMGCELYNVSNPYKPKRLGQFFCGEAQSVWLYGDYAFIGDWINQQVRIVNIAADNFGREVSRFAVDGFADGVCVYKLKADDNEKVICLTASGHHSARLKNRRKYQNYSFTTAEMIADGYGCGHKITITDVTDVENPEYISEISAPPMFGGVDFWRVVAAENRCWFVDSMNGLFEIDITDLTKPRFLRRFRLPPCERQYVTPPSVQVQCESVTGMTIVNGRICVTGGNAVSVLDSNEGILPKKPYSNILRGILPATNVENVNAFYAGNVHSFSVLRDKIYCACGNDGITVLDEKNKTLGTKTNKGYCCDIIAYKNLLVSAEGNNGVAVYRPDDMVELARLNFGTAKPVREVVACGEYICVLLDCKHIGAIKITTHSDGSTAAVVCGEAQSVGMLYYRHLSRTLVDGKLLTAPLAGGPCSYDVSDNGLIETAKLGLTLCPFEDGVCGYSGGVIIIMNGKYRFVKDICDCEQLPEGTVIDRTKLRGQPYICGDKLVLLNRITHVIEILDVKEPQSPRFIKSVRISGFPEFAGEINGETFVATGVGGMIKIEV